jgi:Bacterial Ig domain/Domain of unknown function (DUF4091)
MRGLLRVAAVASVLLITRSTPTAQSAAIVSVAPAAIKILPTSSEPFSSVAEIHAAQNEFEAFQVIVTGPATSVTMVAPTLTDSAGDAIPADDVRLYREEYVNITTASNDEGGTGRWPDALIPDVDETANEKRNAFPFDVPAGENRVVLVEVHVPQGQTPGDYHGTLAVRAAGLDTVNVPVTVRVWNFSLPSTSSLASTFGMGWNSACVAHYGSYEACGFDAGVERLHLMYARFLLDHRITADVVYTGPTGCSGPDCDWTHFDALYGPLFDGTDTNLRLRGAKQTSIRYIWIPDPSRYQAWAQHFRQRGWFDRTYDYTCDEPSSGCAWSDIDSRATIVHGADPDFRTLVTTSIDDANANGVTQSINILTPIVNAMDDKPGFSDHSGNQRSRYNSFLLSNSRNELWWYQSCVSHGCFIQGGSYFSGWPSFVVDDSAVQNRAQGMLSWLYGMSGVLYYRVDLHLPTAWSGGLYDFGGNGDGTLLYPGKPSVIGGQTDIPIASLRLKMMRDGFEDYEYMKLVSDLGDPAFAQQTGQALFPDVFSARQSPAALDAAREALAARILALKGSSPGGPTVVMTSPADGATVAGTTTLACTASDPTGIAGVTFLIDGVAVGNEVTAAPYALAFDTTSIGDGTHTIAARARNSSNMTTTSAARTIVVHNTVQPSPAHLTLATAVSVAPAAPFVGQNVTATFVVQNTGGQPISAPYFLAAARSPSNVRVDFEASPAVTLQPGQEYVYQASRSFAAGGAYSIWPVFFDGANEIELAAAHTVFGVLSYSTRVEENNPSVLLGPDPFTWSSGTDVRASGNSYVATARPGAQMQLTFVGTGISILGITDSCSGQATVDVDGNVSTIDAYGASATGWQQVLFSASGLGASVPHTLTLTVLGTKQSASCGSWIYVDAFDISGAPSAPATITRLEETASAVVQGPSAWPSGSDSRASGGRFIAVSGGNATITVTFSGTGISWIGITDSCSGQATVDIDGVSQMVDAYRADSTGWQQVVFSKTGLPDGQHTFRLTALGTKQAASCGSWIYVDAFDITR